MLQVTLNLKYDPILMNIHRQAKKKNSAEDEILDTFPNPVNFVSEMGLLTAKCFPAKNKVTFMFEKVFMIEMHSAYL